MEPLADRIQRVLRDEIALVPYDPRWPSWFAAEKAHLRSLFPERLLGRVEHFGSTAVPGLAAKPIIDMLVEVSDLSFAQKEVVPVLIARGYDYFWRPTRGDDTPPFYAWFIKRDPASQARTHHLHMVEPQFQEHWDRLRFRDYLIAHPDVAREYQSLKLDLAAAHARDRVAYTEGKSRFIAAVMERALIEVR